MESIKIFGSFESNMEQTNYIGNKTKMTPWKGCGLYLIIVKESYQTLFLSDDMTLFIADRCYQVLD